MKQVPLSVLRSESYDLMSALDMKMDLEKLSPPDTPQPPDEPDPPLRPKPLSTKEQRIEWLVKNPGLLWLGHKYLVNAMKQDGLIRKKTSDGDVVTDPLVEEAFRRIQAAGAGS